MPISNLLKHASLRKHQGDAAALLASRMLRERGITWEQLLMPQLPPQKPTPGRSWFDDVTTCVGKIELLSEWEAGFVSGLRTRRTISPRQRAVLADIVAQLERRRAA